MTVTVPSASFPFDEYRTVPLPGDASTRNYFRLMPLPKSGRTKGMGAGRSLILMVFDEPGAAEAGRNFAAATWLFRSLGCPVPRIVHAGLSDGRFVLEDLGDQTLERTASGGRFPLELYERSLEILIRIQAGGPGLERSYPGIFSRRLDEERIRFELGFLRRHGLERSAPLKGTEARAVDRAFAFLAGKVAALPRVLSHRDFHSRNIMVRGDTVALVDYQDALLASPFYDPASLLRDSYTRVPPGAARNLLEGYLGAARDAGLPVPASDDKASALFDLVALQRNVKALGTFAFQGLVRGHDSFLKSIPKTLEDIRCNPAVSAPELASLPGILEERLGGIA